MKLVPDAKNCHRWWSVRLAAASAAFSAVVVAYATLPADWLPGIPQEVKTALAVGALLTAGAAGFARVVDQPGLRQE